MMKGSSMVIRVRRPLRVTAGRVARTDAPGVLA